MTEDEKVLLKLTSDVEQERAACADWLDGCSPALLRGVIAKTDRMIESDSAVVQIVGQLARLKLGEAYLDWQRRQAEEGSGNGD